MIFDTIENAELYSGLNNQFKKTFKFLRETDFTSIKDGKVEIDGTNIFAIVQTYQTKNVEDAKWESHRKYIDVQYMLTGAENMGFVLNDYLEITEQYNHENDIEFLKGLGDFVQVNSGEFVVFFPHDAHMPGVKIKDNEEIRKVVVKIRI